MSNQHWAKAPNIRSNETGFSIQHTQSLQPLNQRMLDLKSKQRGYGIDDVMPQCLNYFNLFTGLHPSGRPENMPALVQAPIVCANDEPTSFVRFDVCDFLS